MVMHNLCIYDLYFQKVNEDQLTLVVNIREEAEYGHYFECQFGESELEVIINLNQTKNKKELKSRKKYKHTYNVLNKKSKFIVVSVEHSYGHPSIHNVTHNVIDPRRS